MNFKKKIAASAVLAFGLTLTGCSGKMEDFDKQLEKATELAEKGDIFEDDYKMKIKMKTVDEGEESTIYVVIKVDDEEMYLEMETDVEGTENDTTLKLWVGEENDKYYVFMEDSSTESKEYDEITEAEAIEISNMWKDEMGNLEDRFLEMLESAKQIKETCGQEDVTCSVEKNLFGTEATLKTKTVVEEQEIIFNMTIKKGKMTEVQTSTTISENSSVEVEMNFNYDDQNIKLPSKSKYTYKDGIGME